MPHLGFLLVCSKKKMSPCMGKGRNYFDSSFCKYPQVFLCNVAFLQMDPSLLCCMELL